MKKICVTTKTLGRGGSETLLKMILPQISRLGYEVHVVYFMADEDEYRSYLESQGVIVHYVGELGLASLILTSIKYLNYLKKNSFSIIFDNSPLPSFLSRLFKRKEKIVYLEHCLQTTLNPITRFINKFTYFLNDRVICCSDEVFYSNGQVGVILNNCVDIQDVYNNSFQFDLRRKLGWPEDCRIITNVANMSHNKNQKMLVDAFDLLSDENTYLLIVGIKKEAYLEIEAQVKRSKNSNRILIYGPSHNVPTILRQSDVFALTSFDEGLPISLLEAMSLGVVPVCTRVGGMKSVIDKDSGFLVNVADIESTASAFETLLNDHMLQKQMQECARLSIRENYDVKQYVESLDSIFDRLLTGKS